METSPPLSDDLLIGAEAIAMFLYGREDRTARANVYRNVLGLTFFKHGGIQGGSQVHDSHRISRNREQGAQGERSGMKKPARAAARDRPKLSP